MDIVHIAVAVVGTLFVVATCIFNHYPTWLMLTNRRSYKKFQKYSCFKDYLLFNFKYKDSRNRIPLQYLKDISMAYGYYNGYSGKSSLSINLHNCKRNPKKPEQKHGECYICASDAAPELNTICKCPGGCLFNDMFAHRDCHITITRCIICRNRQLNYLSNIEEINEQPNKIKCIVNLADPEQVYRLDETYEYNLDESYTMFSINFDNRECYDFNGNIYRDEYRGYIKIYNATKLDIIPGLHRGIKRICIKNSYERIFRVFHYESITEITKESPFHHLATISAEKTFDEMINNKNYSVIMEQFLEKERGEINTRNNRQKNRENRRDNYEYSYAIGCFDENETRVYILEDGIRKRIYLKDLKRGDIVLETDSKRRGIRKRFKIVHIMRSLCPKGSYLAKYQNIISTPWHPIQINGVYKPSIYDKTTTRIQLESDTYVISFSAVEISNTGETIGFADGIPLINSNNRNNGIIYGATFGHGNKTKELAHPFWGVQLLEIFDALDSEYPDNNGKFEVKLRNVNNIYSIFYNSKEYAYA
jgi:hypothetical protein